MPREIRCRNLKGKSRCKNTFMGIDGRRRFCDACRLGSPKREWKRKSPLVDKTTYKTMWKRLDRLKKHTYNNPEAQKRAEALAKEAEQVLSGAIRLKPRYAQILKPGMPSRCYQCGLRLLPTDTACPRCGWTK